MDLSRVDPAVTYRAGRETALLFHCSERGRITLTGAKRQDLLHRITTNDIRSLVPGQAAPTLLVTAKGRIQDRILVLCRENDLLLITSRGTGAVTAATLSKYVVFEDVQVNEMAGTTVLLGLHGPKGSQVLQAAGVCLPDDGATHGEATVADIPVTLIREAGVEGESWLLLVAAADGFRCHDRLLEAGAELGIQPGDGESFEVLRIEAGMPGPGEIREDWNPLEMRMEDAVSFDKGCYVGQEVLARLRTYDKVKRHLLRIEIDGEAGVPEGAVLGGGGAGVVTSAAPVPGEARTVALALMDGPPGSHLENVILEGPDGKRPVRVAGPPVTARDVRVEPPSPTAPGRKRFANS